MELSFEYYGWLRTLNENPVIAIFASIFGSLLLVGVTTLFRRLLAKVGLRTIAEWKLLDDLMTCLVITGIFGGFFLLIFVFVIAGDSMGGVRLLLIWLSLFLCVCSFYFINKIPLKKWYNEVVDIPKKGYSAKK